MAVNSAPHQELLERLVKALDDGRVSEGEIARLIARPSSGSGRKRPQAATILYALGTVMVFGGFALAYGTVFGDLPWLARIASPFTFPVIALGASVALARRQAPRWQVDLAGLVGYASLIAAFATAATASGWVNTAREGATFAAISAVAGLATVLGLHALVASSRLAEIGGPLAVAVFAASTAYAVGIVDGRMLCWIVLAEAALAAGVAVLVKVAHPGLLGCAIAWATLLSYASIYAAGLGQAYDFGTLNVWHGVLAATVVGVFLTAGALDRNWLIWLGAAGGAAWLVMIAVVVGSATSAALAVVLAGVGLVALGLLVARLRRAAPSA
jgi:hypothetical protein